MAVALPKLYAEDAESIYKVDTVPPPDGDDDAYSAATKVGPLSTAQVAELMRGSADAPPQSGIQVRPRNVTVDSRSIDVDIAGLDDDRACGVPAGPQRVALAALPAPALLPPLPPLPPPSAWRVAPMPMPVPIAAAPPALTTARPVRSRTAFVVAIVIAALAVFATGAWMFVRVFVKL